MSDATRFETWRRTRSREALVGLLEECQNSVYNLCLQVLRHPHDAEDAAQRVFLDLLHVLPRLSGESHFRGWLYRASIQTALNLRRSERRRMRHENAARPGAGPALPDEVVDEIHQQISDLDVELRNVVVEHHLERRPLAELAAARGCSTSAVWKKVQKAQEQLRSSLVRAGFASGAAAIVAFLESRDAAAAPPGLLSPELLSMAGEAAGGGSAALLAGGAMLKSKAAIFVALTAAAGLSLLGVAALRNHAAERAMAEADAASARLRPVTTLVVSRAAASSVATPEVSAAATTDEPIASFASYQEFWTALHKAMLLQGMERGKALRRLGIRRSNEEIEQSLARVKRRRGSWMYSYDSLPGIVHDWMLVDPAGAAAFLKRVPSDGVGDGSMSIWRMLAGPIEEWIERNPEATRALVQFLPDDWGRERWLRRIKFRIDLSKDPESFLGRLRTMAGEDRDEAMKIAMPYWASKSPRDAASWVEQLPEESRMAALSTIAKVWAQSNLPAAQDWAAKYLEENLRNPKFSEFTAAVQIRTAVLDHLLIGAVSSDPRWAAETAKTWETEFFQPFRDVMAEWGKRDPEAAGRYLLGNPTFTERDRWLAGYPIAISWATKDPEAALSWIEQLPPDPNHAQALSSILSAWMGMEGTDPRQLLRRLEKLPELYRADARSGLLSGWADYDPAAATKFFGTLPPEQQTSELASHLAARSMRDDLQATLAWARGLPGEALRNEVLKSIATSLSMMDFQKGVAVAEEISDSSARFAAIDSLLSGGAFRDPRDAALILRKIPEAPFMTYFQVAGSFAAKDPVAGLEWAQSLPETYVERHPEVGEGGPAPQVRRLRDDVIETVLMNWREPEAARRWVEQSTLPQTLRTRLLKGLRQK